MLSRLIISEKGFFRDDDDSYKVGELMICYVGEDSKLTQSLS
jgi:hypothetical protein